MKRYEKLDYSFQYGNVIFHMVMLKLTLANNKSDITFMFFLKPIEMTEMIIIIVIIDLNLLMKID